MAEQPKAVRPSDAYLRRQEDKAGHSQAGGDDGYQPDPGPASTRRRSRPKSSRNGSTSSRSRSNR